MQSPPNYVYVITYLERDADKIVERYKRGESSVMISKDYNCSSAYIIEFLRSKKVKIRQPRKIDEQRALQLAERGLSFRQIARVLGVSYARLNEFLKSRGIKSAVTLKRLMPLTHYIDAMRQKRQDGWTIKEIADYYKCCKSMVSKYTKCAKKSV